VLSDRPGLVVHDLRVDAIAAQVDIVSEVAFSVPRGSAIGIVGESGSGKTTVAMSLLGFARPGTEIVSGAVEVGDHDVLALDDAALRGVRGRLISYVPQNPSRALSPAMRIGAQLTEMLNVHRPEHAEHRELLRRAWADAQLEDDREFLLRYPHQLSGGQQQRVAIAMALVCEPSVIVMDEPTTGLDVLTQQRLLEVISGLRERRRTSIVYVSHDLGVVRNLVDHVAVMYAGRIVEYASTDALFQAPQHPYTRRLLEAIPRVRRRTGRLRGIDGHAVEPWNRPGGCPFAPRCDYRVERCDEEMPPTTSVDGARSARCWRLGELRAVEPASATRGAWPAQPAVGEGAPLLGVRGLVAGYAVGRTRLHGRRASKIAVDGISFDLAQGKCLAIVGESGSGKTTLARCLAGLHEPSGGEITFAGAQLERAARRRAVETRRRIQIVFQDPDGSLNPSMTVGEIVGRPLAQFFPAAKNDQRKRVDELLERVRLSSSMASRMPRDLSGGEKQRVAIARAIAPKPDLLVCDEVTSALDVAVQASILELLEELRLSTGMSLVFVTHDLAVVRTIADSVLVMSAGQLRELQESEALFTTPSDDYTRRLLNAAPDLNDGDYPGWAAAGSHELEGTLA
jgi:peptide/nickel transport system ATP-binding protein